MARQRSPRVIEVKAALVERLESDFGTSRWALLFHSGRGSTLRGKLSDGSSTAALTAGVLSDRVGMPRGD